MNKKLLTIAIAGVMAAPMAAHAIKFKVSGQVNRAVSFLDDGAKSDIRNVDNQASNTRFRMRGSEDMGNGMKLGTYIELSVDSSRSDLSGIDENSDRDGSVRIRQSNLWFSGNWGKLTLGHTSEASDGGAHSDISGTGLATGMPGVTDNSGVMVWQPANATTTSPGDAGDTFSSFDGGRRDVIRYDSPKLGPVGIAASVANDSSWSALARVNTAMGGGKVDAAVYYGQDLGGPVASSDTENVWGVSASFLFAQGTSIGGRYGERDITGTGPKGKSWGVKLGHMWGPHAVSIGYSQADDVTVGYQHDTYNVEYVHSLKKAGADLYAGYQHAELDGRSGEAFEDQNMVIVGARVKFD